MGAVSTKLDDLEKARTFARFALSCVTIILFAAAFFALQKLTFTLRFPPFERTTIWTPGALLFTALLLAPPRRWWLYYVGLCIGAVAAYAGDAAIPPLTAFIAAQFLFVAVAIGAVGIRRFSPDRRFGTQAALLAFVVMAGVVVPIATSGPIDVIRWLGGADDIWSVAVRSFLCVSLGLLIATPALTLTILDGRSALASASWLRVTEALALVGALFMVGHVAFGRPVGETLPPLLYLPVPLLVWAALRFRLAGLSWALLIVAFQSTWGAIGGLGPFVSGVFTDNVLELQLFLLAISLPLTFLAVVIEQRTRAFDALKRSEAEAHSQFAQLQAIYRGAPVGLAFVDRMLRLVNLNDCFAQLVGRSVPELVGMSVREALPKLADTLDHAFRHVLDSGDPVVGVEIREPISGGGEHTRVWLMGHYPVRDRDGAVIGVNSVVEEITERVRAERLRQELIHASRVALFGELTGSLAHEINQPLGAIVSNADAAEMLLDTATPPLDEIRRILGDIGRDSIRASKVIKGLRSMLKKQQDDAQPLPLNDLVRETAGLVGSEAQRRGVQVRLDLAEPLPTVHGDRIQVQQVIMNLLVNGLDALDGTDGEHELVVTTSADGSAVEVAVSDRGPGIPPERLGHVFAQYYSTKKDGMGLGLAIARTIVENHGGCISAENASGGGATFRFRLPTPVAPTDGSSPTAVPLRHDADSANHPSRG